MYNYYIKKVVNFNITFFFVVLCYNIENELSKGAAADGRTEREEARRKEVRPEVQVSFGLGHPPEVHR